MRAFNWAALALASVACEGVAPLERPLGAACTPAEPCGSQLLCLDGQCAATEPLPCDSAVTGQPCDTGLPGTCRAGVLRCDQESTRCQPRSRPEEICHNQLDDDCDGHIDESPAADPGRCEFVARCARGPQPNDRHILPLTPFTTPVELCSRRVCGGPPLGGCADPVAARVGWMVDRLRGDRFDGVPWTYERDCPLPEPGALADYASHAARYRFEVPVTGVYRLTLQEPLVASCSWFTEPPVGPVTVDLSHVNGEWERLVLPRAIEVFREASADARRRDPDQPRYHVDLPQDHCLALEAGTHDLIVYNHQAGACPCDPLIDCEDATVHALGNFVLELR